MSFLISNRAKNIAATANLYHPSKSSNSFVTMGGIALMMVAVNPMPAFALHSSCGVSSQTDSMKINVPGPKVNVGRHCLVLPLRNDLRAKKNYDILDTSFRLHFTKDGEVDKYLPVFHEIADSVKSLYMKRAYVDVDKQKGLVDFSINLGNHVILTIGKRIQSDISGRVMFTISYQGELKVADTLPLAELIKRVDNIQMVLI